MSNVVNIADRMNERRFQQLHDELKEKCLTFRSFKSSFDENRGFAHIAKRALDEREAERQLIRQNLDSRHFAAVISQGRLRVDECKIKDEMVVIAVEGIFTKFEGMDLETGTGFCFHRIYIRVVIRDTGWRKVIIVTAYPLFEENRDLNTPEVNYEEVWS